MPTRKIRRRPAPDIDPLVHHYLVQRMARERAEKEEGRDKAELKEILAESGEVTPEKHRRLSVTPHPYSHIKSNGTEEELTVTGVRNQRRVTQALDLEATEELLREKDLWDECTETVTVISEDKVLAANYEGKITDKELKALYGELEDFAFTLETE